MTFLVLAFLGGFAVDFIWPHYQWAVQGHRPVRAANFSVACAAIGMSVGYTGVKTSFLLLPAYWFGLWLGTLISVSREAAKQEVRVRAGGGAERAGVPGPCPECGGADPALWHDGGGDVCLGHPPGTESDERPVRPDGTVDYS